MADLRNKLNNKKPAQPGLRQAMSQAQVPSFTPAQIKVPGQEQVKKRTEEKQLIEGIPQIQQPQDFESAMQQINQVTAGLSPEQRKEIDQRKQQIESAKQAALKQFQETKDQNQWLQVAESLGQALTQLGAGIYGLKHNVDMSGIQFNKNDWSRNLDQAQRELDSKLGLAAAEERETGIQERSLAERARQDANFRKRAILQDYMQRQQDYKQQVLQLQNMQKQLINQQAIAARQEKAAQERAKAAEAREMSREKREEARRQAQEAKAAKAQAAKEAAEKERMLKKQAMDELKKAEKEVQKFDKALAEATAAKEGAKGANLEKVAKVLGGEKGEEFREKSTTPTFSIFGYDFFPSMDEEEAVKVVKGYKKQAESYVQQLKNNFMGLFGGDEEQAAPAPQPQLSAQDKQALDWANANPKDPRAIKIKQRLGQ